MFPNSGEEFPLVPVYSQLAGTNFRKFRRIPKPREEISACSSAFPNSATVSPRRSEHISTCGSASKAKLGKKYAVLRQFPFGFRVLLGVEREFVTPNLHFLYAERAFAEDAIHLCDGEGGG